jgi:hypothetical protein
LPSLPGAITPETTRSAIHHAQGGRHMTPATAIKVALCMTFLSAVVLLSVIPRVQNHYGTGAPTGRDVKANATALERLMKPENSEVAAHYVVPILFPLDLLLLASLAAFMMIGSIYFAADVGIPARWAWLVLVIPVIYMAADLSENVLLSYILSKGIGMTEPAVAIARAMTRLKWVTVELGLLQTLAIMSVGLARWFFVW